MREIKFRAWDTENKTWTFATLGDLICGACTKKGDKPLSGAKQVWEQYTGLKDSNGKEIYEGDILQDESNDTAVVIWREHHAEWCIKWIHMGREDSLSRCMEWGHLNEIIGNIHENPELLEQEDAKD